MLERVYAGVHPCAFCPTKYTSFCDACSEFFQAAIMEEDFSVDFLLNRDMSSTEFSGIVPISH